MTRMWRTAAATRSVWPSLFGATVLMRGVCFDTTYPNANNDGTNGPGDIDAFVDSVAELFREDGGAHDQYIDISWPTREGTAYYTGLLKDSDCLLAVARDDDQIIGHVVGKLVGPDSLRLARLAVLESIRVRPDRRGQGAGGLLVAEFFDLRRASAPASDASPLAGAVASVPGGAPG